MQKMPNYKKMLIRNHYEIEINTKHEIFIFRVCVILFRIILYLDIGAFERNGIEQHDKFRSIHGTPPIEMNNVLNTDAAKYAEVLASSAKLSYSDPKERPGQGENIAVRCSDDGTLLTAKEAVTYW